MRPSKEEFDTLMKEAIGESLEQKCQSVATKLNVTSRTIRNWYEAYKSDLRVNETVKKTKNFADWMTNYHEDDPKPKCLEVNASVRSRCLIIAMADTHLGSKACLRERLLADITAIKDLDNVFVLFLGDVIDWGPDAPKGLAQDQQLAYQSQIDAAKSMFDEIGHKVLALTSGCHSHFGSNATGKTLEEDLAEKTLTGAFLNDGGVLNLTVGNIPYKIFMTHRTKGSSKLNPSRAIMQLNELDLDFDIGIEAHRHTPNINVSLRRQKSIVAINCGAYKGLDTFANRFAYIQQPTNIPGFILDSEQRRILPFIDWREGLDLVNVWQQGQK
jgi:hypothetical protein